jgi:hypothetical protein
MSRRVGWIAATLLASLAIALPAGGYGISGAFTDDDGNPHEPAINAIAEAGITAGCGGTRYCPLTSVTRGEMATFLARALNLSNVAGGPFTDIGGNIHAGAINAIYQAGITAGCGGGRYCPNNPISRAEMATFLARAFSLPPSSSHPFTDIAGSPHAADIAAIYRAHITAGCAPTRYCPSNPVLRDQMATFLTVALGLTRIYPQVPIIEGVSTSCTKDGLVCSGTVTIPIRGWYEFREGFYTVDDPAGLTASNTRVELSINGFTQSVAGLPTKAVAGRQTRQFKSNFSLAPGTHTFVVRWVWRGYPEQTTTVRVSVR